MGLTIAQKIIKAHLVEGEMIAGQEIALHMDQTLTQDATDLTFTISARATLRSPRILSAKNIPT